MTRYQECEADDCDKPAVRYGLCRSHADRSYAAVLEEALTQLRRRKRGELDGQQELF